MKPLISIIIPCYNMGSYLKEAVYSVKTKHSEQVEIIIVNDGSDEQETLTVLRELERKGFFVLNQENMGLAMARNNGIMRSKGDFIIPLDADNKIRTEFIDISIKTFSKKSNVDIIYSDAEYFGEKSGRWIVGKFDFPKLLMSNYIDACACFRKEVWVKLKGYDRNMPFMGSEDWDFWLRAHLNSFTFLYIPLILFDYRVRKDSMVVGARENGTIIADYMFSKSELFKFKEIRNYINKVLHESQQNRYDPTFKELLLLLLKKVKIKMLR